MRRTEQSSIRHYGLLLILILLQNFGNAFSPLPSATTKIRRLTDTAADGCNQEYKDSVTASVSPVILSWTFSSSRTTFNFFMVASSSSLAVESISRSRKSRKSMSNSDLERKIVKLGRLGKTDEALELYYSVDQPTVRIMNGAIDACSRARPARLEDAFAIFDHAVLGESKNRATTTNISNTTMKTASNRLRLKPNVFTFGSLINTCSRARDAHKAIEVLRSMEKDYGVMPNEVVYSSAIAACARSAPPKPDIALKLLKEVVEERQLTMNVVGFNAAISALAQASDWQNAVSILSRMEDAILNNTTTYLVPEPDAITYGTVLAACERAGQWKKVLSYSKSMQTRGLSLDGMSIMSCLHACAELGFAQDALQYLDMMKSVNATAPQTAKLQYSDARRPLAGPDAVAYRCAISACARGGAWKEGIRLLEECKNVTGTSANVVAYTAAITGCEYAGEWKQAFFLLDKMRKEGIEPNEMTMGAIIGACANACARDEQSNSDESDDMPIPQRKAMQLLNVLKKDPTVVKPNIHIYNAAMRVCAEANDIHGTFRIFEELKEAGIDRTEVTYGILMTASERVGNVEGASKVFRFMKEDEITANEIIFGAAISCCRKAKEPHRALLLLKKMLKEELYPNTACLNTVLIAQTEAKKSLDSDRVLRLYKLMKSKFIDESGRPNRQTYNILVNFFAATKQPATAEVFLDKMRKAGFKPDVDLFTVTVAAYERNQQPIKAVKLMQRMQDDGYDFYSVKVLNSAFKKAVKLVNAVGQNFDTDEEKELISMKLMDDEDTDVEL